MKYFWVMVTFVYEMLLSTIVFGAIGASAFAIHLMTETLKHNNTPDYIISILETLHYFVFTVDAICYGVVVTILSGKLVRKVIKLWKDGESD